jgi:hypothetical protein
VKPRGRGLAKSCFRAKYLATFRRSGLLTTSEIMSSTAKTLATLGIIALVVVAAIWVGFFRGTEPAPQPTPPPVDEPQPAKPTNVSPFFTRPGTKVARAADPVVAEVPATTTNLMTDWEDRVDQILGDEKTEVDEKARRMLELFPHFPEAGQVETAQHISNLLPHEDYATFGGYLTNSKTPVSVQDVILADVLNRPNEIKLPLLLETARNSENAKAGEAKEMLELYLEEDHGTDWKKWEEEMNKWLKENPD